MLLLAFFCSLLAISIPKESFSNATIRSKRSNLNKFRETFAHIKQLSFQTMICLKSFHLLNLMTLQHGLKAKCFNKIIHISKVRFKIMEFDKRQYQFCLLVLTTSLHTPTSRTYTPLAPPPDAHTPPCTILVYNSNETHLV